MSDLILSLKKCKVSGSTVFLPQENLLNYKEVREALLKAGGKYKRNSFVFNSDAQPFIDRLTSGESVNIQKEFQFFPTPEKLAQRAVDKIVFHTGAKVGEFSAGQGALVDRLPNLNLDIFCVELIPENADILRKKGYKVECADFLSRHWGMVDIIVLNPPFTKKQDIDHFMHAWEHLNKGGQMVCITSRSWTFASDKKSKAFREFLKKNEAEIEEVEAGEFKESGTNIPTCIVTIQK